MLTIGRNDSKGWNLVGEIPIESFDELHEVIEALLNAKSPSGQTVAFREVRLSTLIDEVYFALKVRTDKQYLVHPKELQARFPNEDIEQFVRDELYGLTQDSFRLFQVLSEIPADIPLSSVTPRDVVVMKWGCSPAGALKPGSPVFGGIVLRLKPAASLMFMLDLLRNSLEGEQLVRTFPLSDSIRGWLQTSAVSAPADRVSQMLYSISIRHARQEYLHQVQKLSQSREPLGAAAELFRKRRNMVSSLHSEMILQVESLVAPLPFFIEYPLALFSGTSDKLQRIRHAQALLNVLCKTFVMLPLEELQQLSQTSERIEAIASQLRGRPLSDGALLDLSHAVVEARDAESSRMSLPLFGGICPSLGRWRDLLRPVVAARNRLHHPPYDDRAFLEAAANSFPPVIAELRDVLSDVTVIIPKHVKPGRGKVIVSALKIMGASPSFQTFEFTTSLSANEFVVNQLAAYRHSSPAVAPLQEWFAVRPAGEEAIDVGLFDRMKGDEPVFSFVGL